MTRIAHRTFDVASGSEKFALDLSVFTPRLTPTNDYACRYVVSRDSNAIIDREVGGSDSLQALLSAAMLAGVDIEGLALRNRWSIEEWLFADLRKLAPT